MSDLIPNPTNPLTIGAPAPVSSSRATAAEGFLEQLSLASARPEPEPEPETATQTEPSAEGTAASDSTERSDRTANESNSEQSNNEQRDDQGTPVEESPHADEPSAEPTETDNSADNTDANVVAHIVLNTVATASPDLEATPDLGEVTLSAPEATVSSDTAVGGEALNLGLGQTEQAIDTAGDSISVVESQASSSDALATETAESVVDPAVDGTEPDAAIETEPLTAGVEAAPVVKEQQSPFGETSGQIEDLSNQEESAAIKKVGDDLGSNTGEGDEGGASDRQSDPNASAAPVAKPSEAIGEAVSVDAIDPTATAEVDSTGTREQATPLGEADARTEKPGSAAGSSSPNERVEVDPGRFVSRVSRAFEAAQQRGGGPIEIRLSPPELGAMQLKLEVKEGVLTATIETENNAARNALLDNLPALRERLAEQQIRVEKFDVDVRDESGGASQQQDDANNRQASDRDARRDRDTGAPSAEANPATAASDPNPSAPTIELGDKRINLVA